MTMIDLTKILDSPMPLQTGSKDNKLTKNADIGDNINNELTYLKLELISQGKEILEDEWEDVIEQLATAPERLSRLIREFWTHAKDDTLGIRLESPELFENTEEEPEFIQWNA